MIFFFFVFFICFITTNIRHIHKDKHKNITKKKQIKISIPDRLGSHGIDFVSQCLQRLPSKRPSADKLLNHPFITEPIDIPSHLPTQETRSLSEGKTKKENKHIKYIITFYQKETPKNK